MATKLAVSFPFLQRQSSEDKLLFSPWKSQVIKKFPKISVSSYTRTFHKLGWSFQRDNLSCVGEVIIMPGCVHNRPKGNNFHGINGLIAMKEDKKTP